MDQPTNKENSSWIPESDIESSWIPECDDADVMSDGFAMPVYIPETEYRPKSSLQLENYNSKDYGFVRDITDPARYAQGLSACEVVGTWSRSNSDRVTISLISSVDALYDTAVQAWAEFQNITLPEPTTKKAPKKIAKRTPVSKQNTSTSANMSSKESQIQNSASQSSASKLKRLKSEKESTPQPNDQKEATHNMFNDLRAKLKGNR